MAARAKTASFYGAMPLATAAGAMPPATAAGAMTPRGLQRCGRSAIHHHTQHRGREYPGGNTKVTLTLLGAPVIDDFQDLTGLNASAIKLYADQAAVAAGTILADRGLMT